MLSVSADLCARTIQQLQDVDLSGDLRTNTLQQLQDVDLPRDLCTCTRQQLQDVDLPKRSFLPVFLVFKILPATCSGGSRLK